MTGTDEQKPRPDAQDQEGSAHGTRGLTFDALRARAQQLSLREQLERQHFLLERLNAASARLLQAIETGDVYEAIGEIIGNLVNIPCLYCLKEPRACGIETLEEEM